jgi:exopolysaccharide biosynthesis polyprenyl glycosylphosphotransferase
MKTMKNYLFTSAKKLQYALVVGDALVLLISVIGSYAIKLSSKDSVLTLDMIIDKLHPVLFLVLVFYLLSMYLFDQYDLDLITILPKSFLMLIFGLILSGFLVSGLLFFLPKYVFGREVLVTHLILASLLLLLWRSVALRLIRKGSKAKRLAIVGHAKNICSFSKDIALLPHTGLELKSVCIVDEGEHPELSLLQAKSLHKDLTQILREKDFDVLAFDSTNGHFSGEEIREILHLKFEGKMVHDLCSLYENLTGKVPVMAIDDQWLLKSREFQRSNSIVYKKVKRLLDLVLASLFLMLTAPLFALIAVVIKLESKGPVLFVQERLGVQWKPFRCCKFRTMVDNAENESGPVWATEHDPRITRFGRILRTARLDELPQLWNILKGEMTFVGPRPIREHFARRLAENIPFYGLRFCVKPGLTGWAQVNYDYAGSDEGQMEKFQYDLFYVLNMSLTLDVLALFKTFKTVIKRVGT